MTMSDSWGGTYIDELRMVNYDDEIWCVIMVNSDDGGWWWLISYEWWMMENHDYDIFVWCMMSDEWWMVVMMIDGWWTMVILMVNDKLRMVNGDDFDKWRVLGDDEL